MVLATVSVTAHKLRSENKENNYVDVCSPYMAEFNITGVQLQRIIKHLIKEAAIMHKEGDEGDLKIQFNIRVTADKFMNFNNM